MAYRLIIIVALFFVSCGCGNHQALEQSEPKPVRSGSIKNEFLAFADQIENSENPFLGRNQIADLETALANASAGSVEKINLMLQLAWHQLRLGKVDLAKSNMNDAFAEVSATQGKVSSSMYKLRALIHLRDAELKNCVHRHHAECCVFPLQGGGVHAEKDPANLAKDDLLQILARSKFDLEAGWLLNVVGMALGNYPENLPEEYRFPPSAFSADDDIGRFVNIAPNLGIDTFNLCGGAIVEDFDGDRLLDIVTSTYDPRGPLTMYRNLGDGQFSDLSEESGLSEQLGGLNCIAADYDNDGDFDILVLRGAWLDDDGQIRNSLLRNDGNLVFEDVTEQAGLALPAFPTQAAVWGDFDNDGFLDLYIGNESRLELQGEGNFPSQLFRNHGDGTFSDIASSAGVQNNRFCKGVAAGDYDNDGDLDLYVSNRGPNRLYRNDGHMSFTDVATELNVTQPTQHSFASWFFDYDNDGWLDLFVAAYQSSNADVAADFLGMPHRGIPPCLYRNLGNGRFQNVASTMGIDHAYLPMGANFGDLDNDGFLDIYLTTGKPDFATLVPNRMLRNDRGRRMLDVTFSGGFGHLQKGHGIAFADIDNDGDQDIYHQLGGFYPSDKFHNALFLNPGHNNHFLTVKLVGRTSNRQAVGARIRVDVQTKSGMRSIHRAVGAVSSFGGSPMRQEIGVGHVTSIETLEVTWPADRRTQSFERIPLDSSIEITEGVDNFRRLNFEKIPLRQHP